MTWKEVICLKTNQPTYQPTFIIEIIKMKPVLCGDKEGTSGGVMVSKVD